jgi:hypothetical protein
LAVLQAQVDDAVAKGARVLCGGRRLASRPQGSFFEVRVVLEIERESPQSQSLPLITMIGISHSGAEKKNGGKNHLEFAQRSRS